MTRPETGPDTDTENENDKELLAVVRGLGRQREPDTRDRVLAAELDISRQPDLRGDRDRDPEVANPWRSA